MPGSLPYINRELSWLDFNERVLQEAENPEIPLFERIKFIGIFSNNQDEFFRVRVATLKRIIEFRRKSEYEYYKIFNPNQVLKQINKRIQEQQERLTKLYHQLFDELKRHNIHIINEKQIKHPEHHEYIRNYMKNTVRTYIFPIMMSCYQAQWTLRDNSIYLAIELIGDEKKEYALIEVPSDVLGRFVVLPEVEGNKYIMFLDDVIRYGLKDIFKMFDYHTFNTYTIKFTRDAELEIDNDISKSFMELISESLKKRKTGRAVRFVVDRQIPSQMLTFFLNRLGLKKDDTIVYGDRYHNLKDLMNFPDLGMNHLQYYPLNPLTHPRLETCKSIFAEISKKDVYLHFPYHSFQYVLDVLREASIDPQVRSIKMTIYRTGKVSNVINALINAARNGKKVTVFMELQARFDEENNIYWSKRLQEEGVRVIQSIPGLKVHSKLILIKRLEEKKIVFYSFIGTGNFNEITSKVYSDVFIFTKNQALGKEIENVFEMFEASYRPFTFKKIVVSPLNTRRFVFQIFDKLIEAKNKGLDVEIIVKLNNLVDEQIAHKIYEAAQYDIPMYFIIRSMCVISPINENLRVISIVGRFLEHSRIIYYRIEDKDYMYITSAAVSYTHLTLP
ncbi:MAG: polyphosphate kinase 1, partial [Bacteroidales bacterium]|nr:polyphosphate kinase 1 [Bacteroidales bacterium]